MLKVAFTSLLSLAAVSSFAADLPRTKSIPAKIMTPDSAMWSGIYAGANLGFSWQGKSTLYDAVNLTRQVTAVNGVTGGVQVGYDAQFDSIVAGVVGDLSAGNVRGSFAAVGSPTVYLGLQGSLRARLGFLVSRDWLIYGTGGLAYANTKVTNPGSFSVNRFGYTVGLGTEYKISRDWSLFTEARYTNLGKWTYDSATAATANYNGLNARVGFNYRY